MDDAPKPTAIGKFIIFLFILGCLAGAWWLFIRDNGNKGGSNGGSDPAPGPSGAETTIAIAVGSEKISWMKSAQTEFAKTGAGRKVRIDLLSLGSKQGAERIVDGATPIHAWAPASSSWTAQFLADWQVKHSGNPIRKQDNLALTPMVYVFWDERFRAFSAKFGAVSATSIGQALAERSGWAGIANKPEWGLFKFGHTDPNQSNSGLMALVLMTNEYYRTSKGITMAQILDPKFQEWLAGVESGVTGMLASTGDMMKSMVLKGPSAYDAVLVYEAVAIDFLKSAQGRWGDLRIVYPQQNTWNDNPFYTLDTPSTTAAQKQAADAFLEFLMSDAAQKLALEHGFRPGNPKIPVLFPESPFTQFQRYGLRNDISSTVEAPSGEVVINLLQSWNRLRIGK